MADAWVSEFIDGSHAQGVVTLSDALHRKVIRGNWTKARDT